MAFRNYNGKFVAIHRYAVHAIYREMHKSRIDVPTAQGINDCRAVFFIRDNFDVRVMLFEVVDDAGQNAGTGAGKAADTQGSGRVLSLLLGNLFHRVGFRHDRPQVWNDPTPGRTKLNVFAAFADKNINP